MACFALDSIIHGRSVNPLESGRRYQRTIRTSVRFHVIACGSATTILEEPLAGATLLTASDTDEK